MNFNPDHVICNVAVNDVIDRFRREEADNSIHHG